MTKEQDIYRGRRAKELLEDPLIVEFFDKTKKDLTSTWENTKIGETKKRERIYQMRCLLRMFESHFESYIGTGAYTLKLEEKKNLLDIFKKGGD